VPKSEDVIVGFENAEDAAVYRLNDEEAILQTIDVITPLVDDPFVFGGIAAANAMSDVYAMGGNPLTALSFVGYPRKGDLKILTQILAGAVEMLHSAGCFLVGGHSVVDDQLKVGFVVVGRVKISDLKRNSTARVGDRLVLTKPIGTGIIATAIKQQKASPRVIENAVAWMTQLNREAAELMVQHKASSATDITGFGLLGHAMEMAKGSGVTLQLEVARIPVLDGAAELAETSAPGGTDSNREYVGDHLDLRAKVDKRMSNILFDPQTSGGLLIAFASQEAEAFVTAMKGRGRMAVIIGRVAAAERRLLQLL
jgi:selenide,water dikinase